MVDMTAFKAWVDEQPADASYNFQAPDDCALARYLQSTGHPWVEVRYGMHITGGDEDSFVPHPAELDVALNGGELGKQDSNNWTFGLLSERLKELV